MHMLARLNIGGPTAYTISLLNSLPSSCYQSLLVCGKVGRDEGDMSYLAKEKNVFTRYIPDLGRKISPLNDLKSYIAIRKIIKQFKPNIIHTHTSKAGAIGRFAGVTLNISKKHNSKIKLIHTYHGHVFHSYFNPVTSYIFILIERFLAKFTDYIIVISPKQKFDICRKYRVARPGKVRLVPLGFNLTRFTIQSNNRMKIRKKYFPQSTDSKKLVGVIGRLTKVKNHRMFLDSIKCLEEKGKVDLFKFLIIGDGELKADLQSYSNKLGISDKVVFTGWQKDMPSIYEALDIVVLTSLNEGTPVTLIEGMAAKKPIVATNVGGVSDLMGRLELDKGNELQITENGMLIPTENSKALAEALIYLTENMEEMTVTANRAKDFVFKHYSMDRLVGDIESLYSELLAE